MKALKTLKNYSSQFVKNEEGIETMEVAVIVAIAAALVGALILIGNKVTGVVENEAVDINTKTWGIPGR